MHSLHTEVPFMCELEERVLTHSGGDWNDIISLELLLEILRMDKQQATPAIVEVLVISSYAPIFQGNITKIQVLVEKAVAFHCII